MVKSDGARRGSTFVFPGLARVWGKLVSAHTPGQFAISAVDFETSTARSPANLSRDSHRFLSLDHCTHHHTFKSSTNYFPANRRSAYQGHQACIAITSYLLERNFYTLISQVIRQTPTQSKISPSLISLVTAPLATFPSPSPCISPIFTHIFTIPLLPNRIPLDSLSRFITHIPFSDRYVLEQYSALITSSTTTEDKVHLVANLQTYVYCPSLLETRWPLSVNVSPFPCSPSFVEVG
ncbi:uncharacterized protein LACBIDRAFT_307889 [Laccaria bicolor S238N-H82]|uniref:Predicted protein n=1 Tax=Laccaria bicolor (strain S238N-H82 / ATCC MYA-4686) TaxID=486041 RepID=B0DMG2_LACBS|nr:uncharacterized protein LACBIDRAFT_304844 [Laccaria bicolor S238N-H82]XP_001886388.1 uncharacterized protein LACBIDRAFT_307889 [Laccaria bicolor S238N-H82]EDR02965.1 predicted protein [Laccaria bicolor S238N-H82]EDR04282.1 predicted protein [Laccaria bicolor S238N-H82]|eukprot:XP_001885173.1 predicted protein [Laccaria bicolor S238N-H82]